MEPIKELPYQQITTADIMSRTQVRETEEIKSGNIESYWVPFEILAIRSGFNARIVYDEIDELAESIKANGLLHPLRVDLVKDGVAYIEEGHRRYQALQKLHKKGWLNEANVLNLKEGMVMVYRNGNATNELQRIKNLILSNSGKPLTEMEKVRVISRLQENYGMSNTMVAKELGWSRQMVDYLLILAGLPKEVHLAIDAQVISATAAVDMSRKIKDTDKMVSVIGDAVAEGKVIRISDVKSMNEDGEITTNGNRYTNNFGTYIGGDNDKEEIKMRKTDDKTRQPIVPEDNEDEDTSLKGQRISEVKDEETWVSDVIANLDKINVMVSKALNEQVSKDVDRLIEFSIQKLQSIKEYIQKTPKK